MMSTINDNVVDTNDLSSPGRRIRTARRARGWSQNELAERVQAHKVTVSRWENDRQMPAGRNLDRLADALELTPAMLAFGANSNAGADATIVVESMIDAANRIAEVYRRAAGVARINDGIRALDEVTTELTRLGVLSAADLAAWRAYKRRAGYHGRSSEGAREAASLVEAEKLLRGALDSREIRGSEIPVGPGEPGYRSVGRK